MSYLSFLTSGLIPYFFLAILVVLLFATKKNLSKEPGNVFSDQKWNLYDVLIYLLILDCSFIIVQFFNQLIELVVFWALNASFFYVFFKYKIKQSFLVLGLTTKEVFVNILYGLKITIIVELISYGFLLITTNPLKFLRFSSDSYEIWIHYQSNFFIISFLVILFVFFIPLLEELIFRGLIYSPFRKKVGKWSAIVLSATLFALYHGQFFNGYGVIFAYIYEKRRSLIPCIIAHSFFDLCHLIDFIYVSDFFNLGYRINARSYVVIMLLIYITIFLIILFVETVQGKAVSSQQ